MLRMAHRILDANISVPVHIPEEQREMTLAAAKASQALLRSPQMEIVIADNVSDFYHASEQMKWGDDDFPHVAPPFPVFCIEHRCPPRIVTIDRSTGKRQIIDANDNPILQVGYVFMAVPADVAAEVVQADARSHRPTFAVAAWKPILDQCSPKWIVQCVQWMTLKRNSATFPTGLISAVGVAESGLGLSRTIFPGIFAAAPDYDPEMMNVEMHVAWLTLSFMHCKNVRSLDATGIEGPGDKWLSRKRLPKLKYRVLDIGPMREVLRTEGQSDQVGLSKAMHICRGHFATYTAENPLFGKFTGNFWRPAHVRGAPEFGLVQKDYKVNPTILR